MTVLICGDDRWDVTLDRNGRWRAQLGGGGWTINFWADTFDELKRNVFGSYEGIEFDGAGVPHDMLPDVIDLHNRIREHLRKEVC